MTEGHTYNVLFLCTGNSARSIIAEVLLNRIGRERFRAFSAGSHPRGEVHPLTLKLLAELGESTEGLRSKGWDEFARPDAAPLDFVFTVCSKAAGEQCPVWPGQPMTARWGVPDPAAATGSDEDKRRAFFSAYSVLGARLNFFLSLPLDRLDRLRLKGELDKIGKR